MQKHLFWAILLLVLQKPLAQQPLTDQISGTLTANANLSTTVILPAAIKQAVCGAKNFRFVYSEANSGNVGILKGMPGKDSNLLVITSDELLYSFTIKYADTIKTTELNHFITKDKAIGSLSTRTETAPKLRETTAVNYTAPEQRIPNQKIEKTISNASKRFCDTLITSKPYFKRYLAFKNDVVLRLNHINYYKNELYITLRIENNSAIDYQVNFVDFFIAMRKPSKQSGVQPLRLEPLYSCNTTGNIPKYSKSGFVYVFKKMVLDRTKSLVVELNEWEGERNLLLTIPANDINRATPQTFIQ